MMVALTIYFAFVLLSVFILTQRKYDLQRKAIPIGWVIFWSLLWPVIVIVGIRRELRGKVRR